MHMLGGGLWGVVLKPGVGGKKEPPGEPASCLGSSRCRARTEEFRGASDAGLGVTESGERDMEGERDHRARSCCSGGHGRLWACP